MTDKSSPSAFFSEEHRACDALWAEIEGAVQAGDGAKALALWARFDASMSRHFAMEEEILFPAVEQATGMQGAGPTAVMRGEHVQMRGVLRQMAAEADANNLEGLVDQGDTLLMLIQQHNVKEEGVLYPLCDRVLAGQWPTLVEDLVKW